MARKKGKKLTGKRQIQAPKQTLSAQGKLPQRRKLWRKAECFYPAAGVIVAVLTYGFFQENLRQFEPRYNPDVQLSCLEKTDLKSHACSELVSTGLNGQAQLFCTRSCGWV